jgi:hypothetical protein
MLTLVFAARSAIRVAFRYKERYLNQKKICPDMEDERWPRNLGSCGVTGIRHCLVSYDKFGSKPIYRRQGTGISKADNN